MGCQGLTENQRRLLYLLSLYSHPAETGGDKEKWIRRSTALVLLYEGIVAQVLDYDYAPSSEIVESRRMYFNISQVRLRVSLCARACRWACAAWRKRVRRHAAVSPAAGVWGRGLAWL